MIVVHALWDHLASGTLHLWAETSEAFGLSSSRRNSRQTTALPHPFALSADALPAQIGSIAGNLAVHSMQSGTLTLRLPSTTNRPLPSPSLLVEREESSEPILRWWTVNTLTLTPGLALDMLLALPHTPPHGIAFSDSLRFWATAANLSFELLTRQCFAPTLQETQRGRTTSYHTAWVALLNSADSYRVASLASLMPPLCWSSMPPGDKQASLLQEMLRHFLDQTIDAFIRESVSTPIITTKKSQSALKPPEQWIHALTTDKTTLEGTAADLKPFSARLNAWLEQVATVDANTPFRTCFRLETPEEDIPEAPWHITFYLQANDDPSLLIPAEQVWGERSGTLTFLKRNFENPQERLLTDLGKASRLFPLIEKSLHLPRPQEVIVDTEQAYQFLRESAPLLEQSGFGVMVPPWWQKNNTRVRVKLKLKSTADAQVSTGLLDINSLVSYDWQIAIGDSTLSFQEFERLVRLKKPLMQVRGQWVELQAHEIEAAIAFFKKKQHKGQMQLGDALRLGLGENAAESGLQVAGVESEGWIHELLDTLQHGVKIAPIEQPATLHGTLRPYQLKGVSWLAFLKQYRLGACLADDMGLGKCCSADTLILTNGTLQTAETLWEHYAHKPVFDGEGYWSEPDIALYTNAIHEETGRIEQVPIKRLYRQHVSESLRRIHLEDGSSVTITSPHKLLTDKGWTNTLQVGDYVCVPAHLTWQGRPQDPDLVKLLAWQIAEGYELPDRNTVTITQKDDTVLEELKACLYRLRDRYDLKINNPAIHTYADKPAYLTINSVAYSRYLAKKGYQWGHLSREKRIPNFIMQADLDSIRIFLRNFFEAEASVVASMCSIEISTASPLLMQQLSYLLRRFGIWIRISVKQKHATNGTGILRPYQIGVLGGNALRKFCQEIGFVGSKKQGKLEQLCKIVSNTNIEGIPASEIMSQTVAATKLPIRHFGMPTVYVTGTQQFSSASLKTVITAFDSILSGESERIYREKPASKWTKQTLNAYAQLDRNLLQTTKLHLQQLVDQEVYYCKIKAIEEVPYEGWVYDFEVEQHHNYVANNILCHNTVQLITLLLHERTNQTEKPIAPTLLICPMSIVGNWQREIQRFAPSLSTLVHHGPERLAGQALFEAIHSSDIVLTTYALALRDKETLTQVAWENVVLDEAQNIKNETAKQTQAIKQLQAQYKVALTGTPVENRLSELWSIMEFLNPGYLGNGETFRKSFGIPIERYHDQEKSETLRRIIQPFVLRRQKTDKTIIQDLPDKLEMKVYCNLTREQASLYEAVVKEMLEKIEVAEGMERRGLILAALTKLKQVCNHPAQFIGDGSSLPRRSGKLTRLEEMLEEVQAEGDKALIFTQYAEMGGLLRQYLQETLGYETLFLHGGTQKKQRDLMVQRFQQERRGVPFFILSLKAGGVGLNLTEANHVFHFDRWWNPAVENQATDRAFRIGQQRNVQVHKFVCVGTLEERIDQMIEQKKELAENIVGSGENWLTEMSTSQLKEMFALSRDAIGE